MKAAFAQLGTRIAPVFDTASRFRIIESGPEVEVVTDVTIAESTAERRIARLAEQGVGVLVCGAVSRPLHALASGLGLQVIPFVAGEMDEVTRAWAAGDIGKSCFAMPGYCRRRHRPGRGGGGCGNRVLEQRDGMQEDNRQTP